MTLDDLTETHRKFLMDLNKKTVKTREFGGTICRLSTSPNELDEFALSIIKFYLETNDTQRVELRRLVSEPEEVWYFYELAERMAKKIRTADDFSSLEIGLLSLSLVGDHMDPRDLTHYLDVLYRSATAARIQNPAQYFNSVGAISSQKESNTNIGFTSVAREISSYPALIEEWKKNQSQNDKS
jgi:hypothetical protein